jgi:hypothetical protein
MLAVSRSGRIFGSGWSLLLLIACHAKPDVILHDTEGRTFKADCENGPCSLTQKSGMAAPSGKAVAVLSSPASLVGVCDVAAAADTPEKADCRPLVCKQDTECPPAHGLDHGSCVGGYCTEPEHSLGVDDAVMLCLSGTGLGRTTPKQVERYAMALNCGTPCRVPAPCPQP